jgi:hypothetical protein
MVIVIRKASFGTSGMKSFIRLVQPSVMSLIVVAVAWLALSDTKSEHYDVSKKISELVLIPAIKAAGNETLVVANGFSCRHQIHDFAGKKQFIGWRVWSFLLNDLVIGIQFFSEEGYQMDILSKTQLPNN